MMLLITRYIMAFAFSINSGHFIIKCLRYDVMRRQRSYDEQPIITKILELNFMH